MRKVLASFLAAAMVVSVGATMSFAASSKPTVTQSVTAASIGDQVETIQLNIGGNTYDYSKEHDFTSTNRSEVAKYLDGVTFNNVEIDGRRFDLTIRQNINNTNEVIVTLDQAYEIDSDQSFNIYLLDASGRSILTAVSSTLSNGSGNMTVDDADSSDIMRTTLDVRDVFVCGPDGNPLPMTETGVGVDKDQNGQEGVQSSDTVYFMVRTDTGLRFEDDNYWKMRVNKSGNGKYVKAISDQTKNFSSALRSLDDGQPVPGTTGRHRFVKVEMNEIFTDDEYKIALDVTFTPKSKAVDNDNITIGGRTINDDAQLKVKDFYFYMKNIVKNADNDWKVGISGLMLSPLENDWNEVTYYDEDGDLAYMKFFADSDVDKFYAKLSTKWPHEDYAAYFNDQDAFLFQFTGSPKISATSRADLQIYNPFVDEDGNETIDPSTAVVYQIVDGDLYDVTDQFEYKEGDNGDMAFCTRTRFLGTYVICEKAIAEAAGEDETVPEELTPDTNAGAPEEVPADNAGKAPANTGRYA